MSGDWDYYMCLIDSKMASVFLDMEQLDSAPQPSLPYLLSIELTMLDPREDGLSGPQEAQTLYDLEDGVIDLLDEALGQDHRYVGRLTHAGKRVLYSYVAHESAEQTLRGLEQTLLAQHPGYPLKVELRHDPQWMHYMQWLYPGERERAEMSNRRVILKLQEYGDKLHVPRQVEHLALFDSRARAELFLSQMADEGFLAGDSPHPQEDGRWSAQLHRIDPVTLDHINAIVHLLRERAAQLEGAYDGWGCMVIEDDLGTPS